MMQEISHINSEYLQVRDDKKAWTTAEVSQIDNQQQQQPSSPSCLARYSNAPKTQKNGVKKGFFSSFQPNGSLKKKTVHFDAPIEVEPYNWDYSCDQDVYYQKEQIMAMNKQRFTDARKLRKQRNIKVPSSKDKENNNATTKTKTEARDDVDSISKLASSINQLLKEAFDPERDVDEEVSICGIEHFVYPTLQQEMIRRKKHAKQEVLSFKKAKRPERLAELSEENTEWAREVAVEKGMRYCVNPEACEISKNELERLYTKSVMTRACRDW